MSYFVTVVFENTNYDAGTRQRITQALQNIGFSNSVTGTNGRTNLPPNMYAGVFKGADVVTIREDLSNRIIPALNAVGIRAAFFLTVGQVWTWAFRPG